MPADTISIIIPTLNEMKNLPHVLPVIPDLPEIKELMLVDGLSTDDTIKVAQELVPQIKIIIQKEKGKGAALKYAWKRATGDIVVTLDADGSISPGEIPRLIEPLRNGCHRAHYLRVRNIPGSILCLNDVAIALPSCDAVVHVSAGTSLNGTKNLHVTDRQTGSQDHVCDHIALSAPVVGQIPF